jgi:REP element-mobilizing transposase RayT
VSDSSGSRRVMPRRPRDIRPGRVYHLIARFVDREWFITNERERLDYLRLLARAIATSDWRCFAFAVMSNHIHIGTVAGTRRLDSWLRRAHAPFATAMNRAYDRIGPMFVRGPKSLLVEADGVADVIAYIHNNPVRAGLVDAASQTTWTSHRAYAGLAAVPGWLDVREGLARAGFNDRAAFDRWVAEPARGEFDRNYDQIIAYDAPPEHEPISTLDPTVLVSAVADELGISVTQLRSPRRTAKEVCGREATVLCAQRFGLDGATIAKALGVSQQAVSLIGSRGVGTAAIAVGSRVLQRLVSVR